MRDFSECQVAVLTKYSLGGCAAHPFGRGGRGQECSRQPLYENPPRRFRRSVWELGPTFVKLGQVLIVPRVDIFGAEWIARVQEQLQKQRRADTVV